MILRDQFYRQNLSMSSKYFSIIIVIFIDINNNDNNEIIAHLSFDICHLTMCS